MSRHKAVEGLIDKIREARDSGAMWSTRQFKKDGEVVWQVFWEHSIDKWELWHYGRSMGVVIAGQWYESLWIQHNGISVSDQQGINGFLSHLGISVQVSRAGRTAKYA